VTQDLLPFSNIILVEKREKVLFSIANSLKRREVGIANQSYREDLENMVLKRTVKLKEINTKLLKEIS
jgi:hypothetical protein